MSVIQKIQDKYAKVMAVIIALALIIFVIMLAFENGANIFRSNSNTVGKINGTAIDLRPFSKKVDQYEKYYEQQGYGSGAEGRQRAIDAVWGQEMSRIVMSDEFEKLGMQIGKKELGDILYGANPPQDLRQRFSDPNTGVYNGQEAKRAIDQMLKSKASTEEAKQQREDFNEGILSLELSRLNEKYTSMLSNSTNFPKWLIEKQNADNSQISSVSFVREFYTSIPDSSVKVTDKEIADYIGKHKKDFEQEETRGIAYVSFSALPTRADSLATIQKLETIKPAMDSAQDIQQFLESQGSSNYYNSYLNGSQIQIPVKDSIFRTPVGAIYGPYQDANSYAIAKMIGARTQADSVDVRHILIATAQQNPQTGQMMMVRDTASAKKLADSLALAIRNGSNFDSLCAQFSDDGNKSTGGKYDKVTSGRMVAEFNEFIFGNPVGSKGVVKTQFGYHYVEILSQKGYSPAYKVAYLSVPIETSNETENFANNEATSFAAAARDQKTFDAAAEKLRDKGINKAFAPEIGPNSAQVMGLGANRTFVKSIYEAKLGEVLQPEKVGDNWVVAIVTDVSEKGTQTPTKARMMVEPLLRNQKKAELIKKKLGTITTLEAASAVLNGRQIENVDSIRIAGNQSMISGEPKIIGAAFNPANKGKVVTEAIAANNGVYVLRVNSTSATPVLDANVAEQRKARYEQAKTNAGASMQALQKAAEIKDSRSKFF